MSASRQGPRVLYVVYWGATEPLGRSLVVPAVERLASLGVDMTLLTFEKAADWNESDVAGLRASLSQVGVEWIPLRYHKRPKVPATAFDVAAGVARGWRARAGRPFGVVHARTFVGGLMGLALAPLLGAKLVYHNEGFYPDEQVDGGVWRAGSLPHRTAQRLERRLYASADGIIALSRRSRDVIAGFPEVNAHDTPVVVVPSCVDLRRFGRRRETLSQVGSPLRFVYVGSVGARYRLDAAARFVAVAARRTGNVELRVCTRENPEQVAAILTAAGLPPASFSIAPVEHDQIPAEIARHDVGLLFYAPGSSAYGGSPTKVGEYWACGLPVVCSADAGDIDEIVRQERVGVVVGGDRDEDFEAAFQRLLALREEADLAARCRAAAERHYSLAIGCDRQVELYRRLSGSPDCVPATAAVTS